MALSAFDDKSHPPDDKKLADVLGSTFILWNELKVWVNERFGPVSAEWGFASKSTGWGLRLKQETRTVLYMTPCQGYFLTSFVLGEKAVSAAHESRLPASVLSLIDNAKKYAEGRGVRFEVRIPKDIRNMQRLAEIKMTN